MPEASSDRVVVVTGAFGALGAAVARAFGDSGARLGLIDVAQPSVELQREFAGHLLLGGAALATEEATRKSMAAIAMRFFRRRSGEMVDEL
jgi:NAD(P)-dependent dehydrogenase (short-subunit alcohol dehydrogenase family)